MALFGLFPTIRDYGMSPYGQSWEGDPRRGPDWIDFPYEEEQQRRRVREKAAQTVLEQPKLPVGPMAAPAGGTPQTDTAGSSDIMAKAFANIESGGNPAAVTGRYKGLYQLSDEEFAKWGPPGGDIFNPQHNEMAARKKWAAEGEQFAKAMGRPATATDIYMIHQQGMAGYKAHLNAPDNIAWQNIRPFYKSDEIAKAAIWKNLPPSARKEFGSVDNVTSRQFVEVWNARVNRELAKVSGGTAEELTPRVSRAREMLAPSAMRRSPEPSFIGRGIMEMVRAIRGASRNLLRGY
jgi:hypothetical protein